MGVLWRRSNSRIRWSCPACGVAKKDSRLKTCRMCKVRAPSLCRFLRIEVAAKGKPKKFSEGDLRRTEAQASRKLVRIVAQEKAQRGIRKYGPEISLEKVFTGLITYRKIPPQTCWSTQVFIEGLRYVGDLPIDVCHMGVAKELVDYMAARKMVQFRIPADLHEWFKRYAIRRGTTMTDMLIEHIEKLRREDERQTRVEQI